MAYLPCLSVGISHFSHVWCFVTLWIVAHQAPLSEKARSTHFSTLAWKIPWTEEPGKLQSMGSWTVGHNWSDLAAAAAAGSSVHGILQARILEQAANSPPGDLPNPGIELASLLSPALSGICLPLAPLRRALNSQVPDHCEDCTSTNCKPGFVIVLHPPACTPICRCLTQEFPCAAWSDCQLVQLGVCG